MFDLQPNTFICADCADVLREFPDGVADLVLTDPPYGIGEAAGKNDSRGNLAPVTMFTRYEWDNSPPPAEFFSSIKRVGKNQIVWGGNYFAAHLGNSSCWLVWDKLNGENDFADCELAFTSFPKAVRRFSYRWAGFLQGNMACKEQRVHPTQKPVPLFVWCLLNYSKPGDLVIDPCCGSGTTALACHKTGRRFVCIDKEPEYIRIAQERYQALVAQQDLFTCQDTSETPYNNGMELTLPL
jgi:site-specific DNA-methyltransferase (adenine-specific)